MVEAFVCINASPHSIDEVFIELKACKEVTEAVKVHGVYDIIAKVTAETIEDLSNIIETRIKRIKDVSTTLSMLLIKQDDATQRRELLTV